MKPSKWAWRLLLEIMHMLTNNAAERLDRAAGEVARVAWRVGCKLHDDTEEEFIARVREELDAERETTHGNR